MKIWLKQRVKNINLPSWMVHFWKWLWENSKQLELIFLVATIIIGSCSLFSLWDQLHIMRRQYESGMTVEKFKLINDHFNNSLSKDKIFLDLTSSTFSTGIYTDTEYRKFIDEFEFVKVAKDTLDVKERTLCTYYGRTLKKACNEKRIFDFAKDNKKNWFLKLCELESIQKSPCPSNN